MTEEDSSGQCRVSRDGLSRCMLLFAAALMFLVPRGLAADEKKLTRFEFQQKEMGADWRIALYARSARQANNAARAAFQRVHELNGILSDYQSTSEIRRLCKLPAGKPHPVSPDLLLVLDRSLALSRQTDGASDITVGPLTKLWRRAHRRESFPPAEQLAEARRRIGYQYLSINPEQMTATLKRPGMRLDAGGIAKGYAADEALRMLEQRGISHALIDAGGDIVAGDPPPGQTAWIVDVAAMDPSNKPAARLAVANSAVATSGDAFQFVEIDGTRYSHIIDPSTGIGLTNRSSVTVIAPSGIQADGLASALSVLGADGGLRFVESLCDPRIQAFILSVNSDGRRMVESRGFDRFRVGD